MKLTSTKKGFTLVEIMIVVVIIGLLAALAIPAFKKVRNNAIEKTIINDARQISSAANQFFTENATNTTTADVLIGSTRFLAAMSSGNRLAATGAAVTAPPAAQPALTGIVFSSDDTNANSVFTVGNANFDASLSSNLLVTGTGATQGGYTNTDKALAFTVASGQLAKKNAANGSAVNVCY